MVHVWFPENQPRVLKIGNNNKKQKREEGTSFAIHVCVGWLQLPKPIVWKHNNQPLSEERLPYSRNLGMPTVLPTFGTEEYRVRIPCSQFQNTGVKTIHLVLEIEGHAPIRKSLHIYVANHVDPETRKKALIQVSKLDQQDLKYWIQNYWNNGCYKRNLTDQQMITCVEAEEMEMTCLNCGWTLAQSIAWLEAFDELVFPKLLKAWENRYFCFGGIFTMLLDT